MQTKQVPEGTTKPCHGIITKRNRYFTGKYMTERDFSHEQNYFLSRHQLHNRLMHGSGVVCGLEVYEHPDPNCKDRWVVVKAGIAIDCCGRELVLAENTPFELPLPRPQDDEQAANKPHTRQEPMEGPFLVVLRYREQEIEPVPALYDEGSCTPDHYEANRVCEVASIEAISIDTLVDDCWRETNGDGQERCWMRPIESLPGPGGVCLEPECSCDGVVPLARIDFDPDCPEAGFDLDTDGRRHLPVPGDYLTHICGINWPHGGHLTLADLRDRNGRLEIYFDRKIQPPPSDGNDGRGVNEHTLKVQFQGAQELIDLPFDQKYRPKVENDSVAVFAIDPDYVTGSGRQHDLEDKTIYVTLYCDYVIDQHGNPVDGDFLGGRLPSGDASPGGIFRSWFRIVDRDSPPVISMSISGTDTARPGANVTLNYAVTNRSTTDLRNLVIVKDPGLDTEEPIEAVDEPLLAGGPAHTSAYPLYIPEEATSPYIITLQASAVDKDGTHTYDTSQHIIHLAEADPTLEITKCLQEIDPSCPNLLAYEIVIRNNSSQALKDIMVVDTTQITGGKIHLDNKDELGDAIVEDDGRRISWRWRELGPDSEEVIKLKMTVSFDEAVAVIENVAQVTATGPDQRRLRDSARVKRTIKQNSQDR